MRYKESYESDLLKNCPRLTGIKKSSIFNSVLNFHITTNVSFDIMHDILHGVSNYDLRSILYHFIFVKRYFTLDTLNARIQRFHFGPNKDLNKPPEFCMHDVKSKLALKCLATKMLTLLRFLGLMIGDLIEEGDQYWALYKTLRSILDIILSPRVVRSYAIELKRLIENLLTLYHEFFGNLKPKFHNMVHYPTFMLINGPLVNFWTMRFESRHRPLKSVIVSISSSLNLLVSVAIRETLKMYSMFNNFFCMNENDKSKDCESKTSKTSDKIYYKDIELNGSAYTKGLIVVIDNIPIEKYFGDIQSIYKEKDVVKFKLKQYEELFF